MNFCDTFNGRFSFFSSKLYVSAHPLWIIPWERRSVVFQHKYPKHYSNINFVFRHRYPKSYIVTINFYWRRWETGRRKALRIKYRDMEGVSPENFYIPFCKLCILSHSTVLCFLVVKSLIGANNDQLPKSFIISQTRHFFFKTWLNSNFRRNDLSGPSAGYATGSDTGLHSDISICA